MFNKNTNIPWTMPLLITYTMPINPSLLEWLLRLTPGQSGTGAWWCHRRRHWRSGPQNLSPQMMVIMQSSIHSHVHSHSPIHTLKKNSKSKTHETGRIQLMVLFLSCHCPMWFTTSVKAGTRSSGLAYFGGLFSPETVLTKTFVDVINNHSNIP